MRRMVALTVALVCLSVPAAAQQTVSVPVLSVGNSPPAEPETNAPPPAVDEQPSAASPQGMPPQYRAVRGDAAQRDPSDAAIDFLISAPERPVWARATILVDDLPFGQRRQQRVDEVIAAMRQLAEAAAAQETAPDHNAADTADADEIDEAAAGSATETGELQADESQPPEPVDASETSLTVRPPTPSTSPADRLYRYWQATGREPSRSEAAWFLDHWVNGPSLLMLDESFQAARSLQSPLLDILDRNHDGMVSAEELAAAEQTLMRHDLAGDEILSFDEIMTAARGQGVGDRAVRFDPPPIAILRELQHSSVAARLREHDGDADMPGWLAKLVAAAQVDSPHDVLSDVLATEQPEVQIEVRFDTRRPDAARMEVTVPDVSGQGAHILPHAGAITIELAGARIEFSAIQSGRHSRSDQVAIGAVRDGYPLLPLVDRDEDGRLSIREIRGAAQRLAVLDRNGDGNLTPDEMPPTIRVAVGLGPSIDSPLAAVRRLEKPTDAPTARPPDWFVRMDRNRDGDLTPREFLGSREQFDTLDADGDGLISITEALASDQAKEN